MTKAYGPFASQAPVDLGLRWTEGDTVALRWRVLNEDWTQETYETQVRKGYSGEIVAEPTITTELTPEGHTLFTFALSKAESVTVLHGSQYRWDCQAVGANITLFSGAVEVLKQVTR